MIQGPECSEQISEMSVAPNCRCSYFIQIRASLKSHRMGVSKEQYQHILMPAQKIQNKKVIFLRPKITLPGNSRPRPLFRYILFLPFYSSSTLPPHSSTITLFSVAFVAIIL
jgi:hypothetical protein